MYFFACLAPFTQHVFEIHPCYWVYWYFVPFNCWVVLHYIAAAAAKSLQSCVTVWPHRQQPTRLPRLWDSPGKNTGVGCHFLLQCRKVKSESEVAQSCPTLSNPMDCSLPGSSIHGIFQARVLEWGAIAFSDYITFLYHNCLSITLLTAIWVILINRLLIINLHIYTWRNLFGNNCFHSSWINTEKNHKSVISLTL